MKRPRLAVILLLSGIAAAFILGPLLQLKWFSGDLPGSPWQTGTRTAADYQGRNVDASQRNYTLHWAAQTPEQIPALRLRIAPTEWFSLWSGRDGRQVRETGGSPEEVALALLYPDARHPPAGSLCHDSDTAFSGCRAGLARLAILRDGGHWQIRDILQGKAEPPAQDSLPYAQRSNRARLSFWTRSRDENGEQVFHGWSCADSSDPGRRELDPYFVFPEKGAAECFRLQHWWERFSPARFGYAEHAVYFECDARKACSAYFLFRQRMVEIRYEYLAPREAAATRTALAEAGWALLNRAMLQAAEVDRLHLDSADAIQQQHSCRVFSQEAQRWLTQASADQSPPRPAVDYLQAACQRSAETALLLAPGKPAQAWSLLQGVIPAMRQSAQFQGRHSAAMPRLFDAGIATLEASGKSDSPEMLQILLEAMEQANELGREAQMTRIESMLPRAVALAGSAAAQATAAQRSDLFSRIDRYYGSDADYAKWLPLYDGLLKHTASRQGADSAELIEPLRTLGWKSWRAGDFAMLKDSADRLSAVILAQPLPGPGSYAESEAARQRESAAFDAVFFYRNYGFHERRFSETATLMNPLLARMEKTLGPEAGPSKAARFHQREIQTGRAQSGPVGGGFLGQ